MTSLRHVIQNCFLRTNYSSPPIGTNRNSIMMELVQKDNSIEVPLFALGQFLNAAENNPDAEVYMYTLSKPHNINTSSPYSTLASNIKFLICKGYITAIKANPKDELSPIYYVGYGAMFYPNLKPVFVCSWVLEKVGGTFMKKYPKIRVDPYALIDRDDSVKRFVGNTIMSLGDIDVFVGSRNSREYITIEVGDFPYYFSKAEAPDSSIGKEELMQTLRESIDEIKL